jgi:hypothetical protein
MTVTMNIYRVERVDWDYDEVSAYVCIALNGQGARDLGADLGGDQDPAEWHLPSTTVTHIGTAPAGSAPEIILASYKAG